MIRHTFIYKKKKSTKVVYNQGQRRCEDELFFFGGGGCDCLKTIKIKVKKNNNICNLGFSIKNPAPGPRFWNFKTVTALATR